MTSTAAAEPATKWWGESMTIWGALITAVATVLPVVGPVVGIDIPGELVQEVGRQIVTVVQALAGLAGTAMTIYGRVRATQPLAWRALTLKL
jgi:hypothetical protein